MKFALLGADEQSVALATAAVVQGHQIVWCGDAQWARDQFEFPWLAGDDRGDDWETLLDTQFCDAVIVGRGEVDPALRSEQVMVLTKNGVALLTSFPLNDAVLSYYEIDMAREESKATLRHFNPLVESQPAVEQCAHWITVGHPQLGSIEQVVWERPLAERNRASVLCHFARDVELLDRLAGPLNRLGALGSPDEAATYSGLSVQLLGPRKLPVRWAVEPFDGVSQARLTFVAERGKETVCFDEASRAIGGEATVDPAASAIERLVAVLEGDAPASTWPAALCAMELADTIEISLRRGRMIDVHHQQLTEELAFKGTMSALGCGVLMVLPPLLLCLGWLADLVGLPVARFWPHVLLALLAAFLGIQVLSKLLIRKPSSSE